MLIIKGVKIFFSILAIALLGLFILLLLFSFSIQKECGYGQQLKDYKNLSEDRLSKLHQQMDRIFSDKIISIKKSDDIHSLKREILGKIRITMVEINKLELEKKEVDKLYLKQRELDKLHSKYKEIDKEGRSINNVFLRKREVDKMYPDMVGLDFVLIRTDFKWLIIGGCFDDKLIMHFSGVGEKDDKTPGISISWGEHPIKHKKLWPK